MIHAWYICTVCFPAIVFVTKCIFFPRWAMYVFSVQTVLFGGPRAIAKHDAAVTFPLNSVENISCMQQKIDTPINTMLEKSLSETIQSTSKTTQIKLNTMQWSEFWMIGDFEVPQQQRHTRAIKSYRVRSSTLQYCIWCHLFFVWAQQTCLTYSWVDSCPYEFGWFRMSTKVDFKSWLPFILSFCHSSKHVWVLYLKITMFRALENCIRFYYCWQLQIWNLHLSTEIRLKKNERKNNDSEVALKLSAADVTSPALKRMQHIIVLWIERFVYFFCLL